MDPFEVNPRVYLVGLLGITLHLSRLLYIKLNRKLQINGWNVKTLSFLERKLGIMRIGSSASYNGKGHGCIFLQEHCEGTDNVLILQHSLIAVQDNIG